MGLRSTLMLCAAIGASATTLSAAELLVNGGFELGNFTPIGGGITTYDLISQAGPQDLTGWTIGNSLVWGVDATDINTRTGSGFVDLTGVGDTTPHGFLSQSIATLVGQVYDFSVYVTQDFRGVNGIDVFANGIGLTLAGTPGFWDYSPTGATYGQLTSSFTATSTSTTISMAGIVLGSTQFMIGLDDVSVSGPTVSAVPIPATLPLLASVLGLGGLLGWRRKNRA